MAITPRCESSLPTCGPVVTSDTEGVPLCQRCSDEMAGEPSCHANECRCALCNPAPGDQPPPVPNDRPAIVDLVIADFLERKRVGIQRYGTPLQAHNGRDALVDLYQELPDATAYIRQVIEERAVARPLDDWHEDLGPVVWWRFPLAEPPWIGTPLDEDWPHHEDVCEHDPERPYYTHWTPLPAAPAEPASLPGDCRECAELYGWDKPPRAGEEG